MKKKLRLLLSAECNRDCPMCCNKYYNLDKLPVETDYAQYDEIYITGGEPMIHMNLLIETIINIRISSSAKIFVYTAKVDNLGDAMTILTITDGMTLTLHTKDDVEDFREFNDEMLKSELNRSLRLNVFRGVAPLGYFDGDEMWRVQEDMVWVKDCPVPDGEVFRRLG